MENKRIKIKTFGVFDVLMDGKSIFPESVSSYKWTSLLKYLIAERNKILIPEVLTETIWPGNNYSEPKKVARTYIHRLRKVLKSENIASEDLSGDIRILNIKGNYMLELSENVELDIELFEACRKSADDSRDKLELLYAVEEMLSIYDEFLKDSLRDGWELSYRNHYSMMFCRTIDFALSRLVVGEDSGAIIDICERCLKVCRFHVNAHIMLLRALINRNNLDYARSHLTYGLKMFESEAPMQQIDGLLALGMELGVSLVRDTAVSETDKSLEDILDERIREYMVRRDARCALAHIKIIQEQDFDLTDSMMIDPNSFLEGFLESTLRKNDMFCLGGKQDAYALLSGAKPEYYDGIINRIKSAFDGSIGVDGLSVDIKVFMLKEKS